MDPPSSGVTSPKRMLISVVLPAPVLHSRQGVDLAGHEVEVDVVVRTVVPNDFDPTELDRTAGAPRRRPTAPGSPPRQHPGDAYNGAVQLLGRAPVFFPGL
jgi:hypothetical protein